MTTADFGKFACSHFKKGNHLKSSFENDGIVLFPAHRNGNVLNRLTFFLSFHCISNKFLFIRMIFSRMPET